MAGAAHLLNDNTGVLRIAQREQKSRVDPKGKGSLAFDFQYECELGKCSARGVRKVTTGIADLWQPSVHRDVAF